MNRVALVTGGKRGIGEAILCKLRQMGMVVSVTYSGNERATRKLSEESGIPELRWDVSFNAACEASIREVEYRVDAGDVLANKAGVIQDATVLKLSCD